MPPLPYVGPSPIAPNDVASGSYVAKAVARGINDTLAKAKVAAVIQQRADAAASLRSKLLTYVTKAALPGELAPYYKLSDVGKPSGLYPKIPAGATVTDLEHVRNMPRSKWEGPYSPEVINYSSAPAIATQTNDVASSFKLCEFTVPAHSTGAQSVLVAFGSFEGYATDGSKLGRPEVTVVADGKVVGWGAAPNGNGTGQMWPITVVPAVDTLQATPVAGATGPILVTVWLGCSFNNTSVGMGGLRHLTIYRVPVSPSTTP
ncbi:structural protein [Rhodococcus phage E3]|uniref:structural protein n=1 Tax=Rhodococcus phage E3 TaxID=1007869 RepID=UPI0002C6D12A|nr:structural protein [Rhodococcus phage E3]AEQ21129.1 structural protein [Rhodococcus phage E3]